MNLVNEITSQYDKLPPHSIPAEMCLLASMMLDIEMIDDVRAIVTRDAFIQSDHQIIFDVLLHMRDAGRPIDAILLREELIRRQLLDEIGDVEYIARLLSS